MWSRYRILKPQDHHIPGVNRDIILCHMLHPSPSSPSPSYSSSSTTRCRRNMSLPVGFLLMVSAIISLCPLISKSNAACSTVNKILSQFCSRDSVKLFQHCPIRYCHSVVCFTKGRRQKVCSFTTVIRPCVHRDICYYMLFGKGKKSR